MLSFDRSLESAALLFSVSDANQDKGKNSREVIKIETILSVAFEMMHKYAMERRNTSLSAGLFDFLLEKYKNNKKFASAYFRNLIDAFESHKQASQEVQLLVWLFTKSEPLSLISTYVKIRKMILQYTIGFLRETTILDNTVIKFDDWVSIVSRIFENKDPMGKVKFITDQLVIDQEKMVFKRRNKEIKAVRLLEICIYMTMDEGDLNHGLRKADIPVNASMKSKLTSEIFNVRGTAIASISGKDMKSSLSPQLYKWGAPFFNEHEFHLPSELQKSKSNTRLMSGEKQRAVSNTPPKSKSYLRLSDSERKKELELRSGQSSISKSVAKSHAVAPTFSPEAQKLQELNQEQKKMKRNLSEYLNTNQKLTKQLSETLKCYEFLSKKHEMLLSFSKELHENIEDVSKLVDNSLPVELQAKKVAHKRRIEEFAKDTKVSDDHLKKVGIYPESMADLVSSLKGKKGFDPKRSIGKKPNNEVPISVMENRLHITEWDRNIPLPLNEVPNFQASKDNRSPNRSLGVVRAKANFSSADRKCLSILRGERLKVLETETEWTLVQNQKGKIGAVPNDYLF